MLTRRSVVAGAATSMLAGCASNAPTLPLVTSSTETDLKTKGRGLVVMSAAVKTQALWTAEWSAKFVFSQRVPDAAKADYAKQVESLFSIEDSGKIEQPRVVEVLAGSYDLLSFSYQIGNATYSNAAGLLGVPLTTFKIAAGEVLYLGHVLIVQEPGLIVQSKPKYKIEVTTNEAAARQAVAKVAPSLSAATLSRPVVFPAVLAGG